MPDATEVKTLTELLPWICANREMLCLLFGLLLNAAGLCYHVLRIFCKCRPARAAKLLALREAARALEEEAEQIGGLSGAEKLEYVLTRLRQLAAEMRYEIGDDALRAAVETDIAFSKTVNARTDEYLE